MTAQNASGAPQQRLPMAEFIVLMAMQFAMTAFSIDSMLPALPEIAAELSPAAPNRAQLIVTSFVFGMGLGTFAAGPLSDTFGRRRVIIGGAALYCVGAALAWSSASIELIVAARVVQGLGVSGPRIATMALVRDLYSGRAMARILSIMMMVFVLVPAVAPLLGAFIIAGFGWRAIFVAFVLFAAMTTFWLWLRQEETLAPERRRPLQWATLTSAAKEILTHGIVTRVTVALALAFTALFATISSIQPIFSETFGLAESFPLWFAFIALVAGIGNIVNAQLVMRLGMRLMVTVVFIALALISATISAVFAAHVVTGDLAFGFFLFWAAAVFFSAGLIFGNLNALALEPMGHIAGSAASLVSALATVLSVLLAVPIGLAFDGTPLPLMLGVLACCLLALPLMLSLPSHDEDKHTLADRKG